MNTDVHPAVAALVLILTGVAIGVWTWGSGAAGSLGGPAELGIDPDGHGYVQIQHYLVEHDARGEYVRTHDLEGMGVELFLGGFAFFSDGDILLRRGGDPRSFLDNLRAYARKTNRKDIAPEEPGSGLFRCNLESSACERFGEQGVDFKAAYGVFIDWRTDEVFISDTTRHVLRKYSSSGAELAPPVGGFKFPNQLLLHDGQLLLADTNHHVIRQVEPRSSAFGDDIERKDVVPAAAKSAQQTWPSHFARVGEEWWVNNMQSGMNRGGLYVFDRDWQYVRRVDLPPDADPIAILAVGDAVWVSDWNNDVVRRFSPEGQALPDLESAGLETLLDAARQERLKFTMLSFSGVAMVGFILLGLLVYAFALRMNRNPAQQAAQPDAGASITDTAPLHLEPDDKMRQRINRSIGLVVFLTLLAGGALVFLFTLSDKPDIMVQIAVPLAGLFAIVILIAWINSANWGTAITVDGNNLTLRDHTGRHSSCPLRQVRYDDTAIATRDAIVILGRQQARIYDSEDVRDRLLPRLVEAQRVGPVEMLKIQIQLLHPHGIVTLIAIAGLLIFGVFQLAT